MCKIMREKIFQDPLRSYHMYRFGLLSSDNIICMFVHLQVADSKGHTLFRKESATKGRFAFTTEDYDMFEVCFYSIITGQLV